LRGFSETCLSVAEHRLLAKSREEIRVAVLCKHDLSYLEPGDKTHTYDKIMALATQASVMLFTPQGHAPRSTKSRMEVVQVSASGMLFQLALVPALVMHRNDYDCIYTRDPMLMFFATPMKIFGKTLILEMNGVLSRETETQRRTQRVRAPRLTPLICSAIRLIETIAIRYADLVLPITEKMKGIVRRDYRRYSKKTVVVPQTVDTTMFRPHESERAEIRRKLGIEGEMVVLLFSTFSARWRSTWQLFQIAGRIQCKRSDIVFLVVGSGPLLEEIKSRMGWREMLNRILFVGRVDHHLVPLYINASDIYVYDVTPEAYETVGKHGPCPMKILEAMACGKPVIAPREQELEVMLLSSNSGFCASSTDEIESLIERFADSPGLARSMGTNARRYVELNHDLACLTRRTVELIGEVVSSRS